MRKRSKRYKENLKQINKANKYSIEDAVKLALQIAGAKFKESVDISINLNLKASQRVRGTVVYPNSIGKERKVLVSKANRNKIEGP